MTEQEQYDFELNKIRYDPISTNPAVDYSFHSMIYKHNYQSYRN